MTPAVVIIAALVLGLVIGSAVVIGAPVFAIPIFVVALLVLGAARFSRRARDARSVQHHRDRAKPEDVEFTERDRQTLAR